MSNVAKLNSSGALFASVRAACNAMQDNVDDGVTVLSSCIGGTGFALIAKQGGVHSVYGAKQDDGTYPVLINLGVNDDGADRLTYGKAILNIESSGEFGNLTFRGAEVSLGNGGNGAGVRINPGAMKVTGRNFRCIGNQDGLLTAGNPEQELVFEDFELDKNGFGREGYTHNAYFGDGKSVTLRRGNITRSRFGHDLKSRMHKTVVQQMRMSGSEKGRAFDFSNGGVWDSSHSEYIKPVIGREGQNNLVHLAPEGIPDNRPESYTSKNDLFQIDNEPDGRGFEFLKNEGTVEAVLTDPKFVLGGKILTDDEARPYLNGNIRIVSTGGPRGPLLPVGYTASADAPVPTSAPTAPAPTPVQTQAPVPASAAETWVMIGSENETVTVDANTTVRYGANGQYVTKVVSGSFPITNAYFGNDPISGVVKTAEKLVGASAPVAPTPATPVATPPVVTAPVQQPVVTAISGNYGKAYEAAAKAFLEALGYAVTK